MHLTKYIAFLRGINIGGHRVKMERLREIFGESAFFVFAFAALDLQNNISYQMTAERHFG